MMINSIYTNSDIFLRELISNASDALDKRYYMALTNNAAIDRSTLKITLTPNKENRTLTITDNGIGMDEKELESNLGTIAKSGSEDFKKPQLTRYARWSRTADPLRPQKLNSNTGENTKSH